MVIASKPYKPGDLIAEVKPLVYALVMPEKGKRCDSCFRRSATLRRCSRCLKVWYCTVDCQKYDWLQHKLECQLLSRPMMGGHCFPAQDKFMPFLLRLILLYRAKPSLFHTKHRILDGRMMSYQDLIDEPLPKKYVKIFGLPDKITLNFLAGFGVEVHDGDGFDKTVERLHLIAVLHNHLIHTPRDEIGKIRDIHEIIANSLSLNSPKHVINHSCVPSVIEEVVGRNTRLVAAREINAGEQMTVSHISLCQSKANRQTQILIMAGQLCPCKRCKAGDDLDARGLPIDYIVINRLSEQPTDLKNYQRFLTMSKEKPMAIIDRIYPIEHPEKTVLLISLVKAESSLNISDASLIRATIKSMQLTMPNDDVMKFDPEKDDVEKMTQYLAGFAAGQ